MNSIATKTTLAKKFLATALLGVVAAGTCTQASAQAFLTEVAGVVFGDENTDNFQHGIEAGLTKVGQKIFGGGGGFTTRPVSATPSSNEHTGFAQPSMAPPQFYPRPQQVGNHCQTPIGRFGPGQALPLGMPCHFYGPFGPVIGYITY